MTMTQFLCTFCQLLTRGEKAHETLGFPSRKRKEKYRDGK